jgi:hypothetical protein
LLLSIDGSAHQRIRAAGHIKPCLSKLESKLVLLEKIVKELQQVQQVL